jgi:serine phosphatase RsbU (regulator of sigma subunit)
MLRIINDSAREVTAAQQSETILTREEDAPVALSPIHELVWQNGGPVRMTAKEVESAFGSYGLVDVAPGHPMLEGWLAVPLYDRRGRRLGLIQVADKLDGDFSDSDEVVLVQLAQLAAVAIENADRFEQEHSVAEALQRGLLPSSLPAFPGVSVAARYRPGGGGASVGGDWYDVVALPDGRLALTIGDVMGRGPRAAAIMGQVRTALHAYALHGLPASVSMRSADLLLQDVAEGAMATALYLVLDPALRRLDAVSAGHPPPLMASLDGTISYLRCDPHTPLGVLPSPVYTANTATLVTGSMLLLYTDGLVEDRSTGLEQGLADLATAIDPTIRDLGELCDAVIEAMVPAERDDDVCVLAVRLD